MAFSFGFNSFEEVFVEFELILVGVLIVLLRPSETRLGRRPPSTGLNEGVESLLLPSTNSNRPIGS